MTSKQVAVAGLAAVMVVAVLGAQTPPAQQPPAAAKDPAPTYATLGALLTSLPDAKMPALDDMRANLLIAQPFACLDQLQARPTSRAYFWQASFRPIDGYEKTRAFYGCADWHSAVGATVTLAKVLKALPDIAVGKLIREKLADHLAKSNLDGELAFFKDAGTFERPYGYAWLLALQAELQTWDDPEAAQWAANVAPLTKYFAEQLSGTYLKDLDRPVKTGGQTNTALILTMMMDAGETLHDYALRSAATEFAKKTYIKDASCATDAETTGGDLISPCLAEAVLMSKVLDRAAFVPWLDAFLPAANSPKFAPLLTASTVTPAGRAGGRGANRGAGANDTPPASGAAPPVTATAAPPPSSTAAASPAPGGRGPAAGARATPIALAFSRAEMFDRIARALPAADPRVAVFKRLSAIHAAAGAAALTDASALDAAWLGAYALRVLQRQ